VLLDDACTYTVLASGPCERPGRLLLNKQMLRDHYLDNYLEALSRAAAALGGA
jgi:hypothetical protein